MSLYLCHHTYHLQAYGSGVVVDGSGLLVAHRDAVAANGRSVALYLIIHVVESGRQFGGERVDAFETYVGTADVGKRVEGSGTLSHYRLYCGSFLLAIGREIAFHNVLYLAVLDDDNETIVHHLSFRGSVSVYPCRSCNAVDVAAGASRRAGRGGEP